MTIYANEIKLMQSQRMTDTDDGGGRMTGVEIVSGEHNTIFPDISDVDRAYGVVNIRSVHAAVQSPNADTYYGATIGLLEPPVDENVNITLMSINDPYAIRSESKDIIERYLARSAKWQGELYNTQLAGQRAIRIIQRSNIKLPVVGEVLMLLNKSTSQEQYVKVTKVESNTGQFSHDNFPSYTRKIVTCEISESLRYEFIGVSASPYDPVSGSSALYETQVADAAKYYSVKPLRDNAAFGDTFVTVPSVYTHLVPSARIDTPHIAQDLVKLQDFTVKSSADGAYEVAVPSRYTSDSFKISTENQGYVYTKILEPAPAFGNTLVSYMVNGDWYELRDDENGVFSGADPSYGTGQLDQAGNISITLGALPDIESAIVYQWGDVGISTALVTQISADAKFTVELKATPRASSLVITWDDKTATVENNTIVGDATGTVRGRMVEFVTNTLPAPNTAFTFSWDLSYRYNQVVENDSPLNDEMFFTLPQTVSGDEVVPGSVSLDFLITPVDYTVTEGRRNYTIQTVPITVKDNGSGILTANGQDVGTIDYVTRECVLSTLLNYTFTGQLWGLFHNWHTGADTWRKTGTYRQSVACTALLDNESLVSINKRYGLKDGSESGTDSEVLSLTEITATATTAGLTLVPDSLVFTLAGRTYAQQGYDLYESNVKVGTVDANTGVCTLTDWDAGSKDVTLLAGLLQNNSPRIIQSATFITAGSPVASQSLQISAYDYAGNHVIATADVNGGISGSGISGTIDYSTGIVQVHSGALLDASTFKYNCVSYNYLPLDADLLGLDPIRLPSDGRVVIYRSGDLIVIHQDKQITQVVSAGETVDVGEVRLVKLEATGSTYTADLDAGTITFDNAAEVVIDYRFEDMIQVIGVDISGQLKLSRAISHSYDADQAFVASILIAGNLWAHYDTLFDQQTWTSVWSDDLIGNAVTAQYNDTDYPLILANDGAITERWVIEFTSSTSFKLVGENVGQIAVGDVNNNFAPNNPNTAKPYFTLNKLGWGAGWSSGNCLRFNTLGAVYQTNVIRTILQGDSSNTPDTDQFALQIRGNINKEI